MTSTFTIPKLSMLPRSEGGTGVTNFQPELMPIFRAALEESGREDLVLCSVGYGTRFSDGLQPDLHSLHCTAPFAGVSDFFAIFDRIRNSQEVTA